VFSLGLFTNRPLLLAIVAELAIVLALIYLPPLNAIFHLLPLQPEHWLLAAIYPVCILLCEEARKLLRRRYGSP
jgi:magnesium-transporting ATPase (P-type)